MSDWSWTPERNLGIWRHGAGWLRPVMAAVPFLTIGLLLLMMQILGGTLTSAKGVLFDLPEGEFSDVQGTGLVALVMPIKQETMVFFDDSRYLLGDVTSMRSLSEDIAARIEHRDSKSMLILSDRRVSAGSLMELVTLVRKCGVEKVLVAGKQSGDGE